MKQNTFSQLALSCLNGAAEFPALADPGYSLIRNACFTERIKNLPYLRGVYSNFIQQFGFINPADILCNLLDILAYPLNDRQVTGPLKIL